MDLSATSDLSGLRSHLARRLAERAARGTGERGVRDEEAGWRGDLRPGDLPATSNLSALGAFRRTPDGAGDRSAFTKL
ncbi:hypothetical protein DYI37_07730 [Fulvimarina endophytica]|uniref:Uncharacterized protein n=1 Tax=Fulvimarina endophytica TaxID=2293836 RepID=A0A371X4R0_9HYPH|nr:hypothetical protein DYI37_07730 [Fulvimarina endophytica]